MSSCFSLDVNAVGVHKFIEHRVYTHVDMNGCGHECACACVRKCMLNVCLFECDVNIVCVVDSISKCGTKAQGKTIAFVFVCACVTMNAVPGTYTHFYVLVNACVHNCEFH